VVNIEKTKRFKPIFALSMKTSWRCCANQNRVKTIL